MSLVRACSQLSTTCHAVLSGRRRSDSRITSVTAQISTVLDVTPLHFPRCLGDHHHSSLSITSVGLRSSVIVNVLALAERNRFPRAGQSPRLEKSGEMQDSKEWDHKRRDEHQG